MGWVVTLMGALIGFAASVIPEVISIIKMRQQGQILKDQRETQITAAQHGADLSSTDELVQSLGGTNETVEADPRWVNVLRSTVRPFVTYIFFAVFITIKMVSMAQAYIYDGTSAIQFLPVLWDTDTNGLFAAVISFWFGQRAVNAVAMRNGGALRKTVVETDGEK